MSLAEQNAHDLEQELAWFSQLLVARLEAHLNADGPMQFDATQLSPPTFSSDSSCYAEFVNYYEFGGLERAILVLALIPHIRPQLLDVLKQRANPDSGYTEFGGVVGQLHGGFIPTVETALFIIAGNDLSLRFAAEQLLDGDHVFRRHNILELSTVNGSEPKHSAILNVSAECLSWFTNGQTIKPDFSANFPAKRIETQLDWPDLILPTTTLEQLEEIKHWVQHQSTLMEDWGMGTKLRPGYTSLFYGPSGTGKTLTACLLGKYCKSDVYSIDLSLIVSKYIGETEKNLSKIFDMAEHKNWILFFDEADALFGKRTKVNDAHDRYANQEVSYLLQRIEDYQGVVILASNLKANIDDAFLRRFQSVISFSLPKAPERLKMWNMAFSPKARLDDDLDLAKIAERHELSGGTIMNVVRYASLKSLSRDENVIRLEDIEAGVRREFLKQGKTA